MYPKIIISLLPLLFAFSFEVKETLLQNYDFTKPLFVYELDMGLTEISGLAVNDEGRLFAHNDEIGSIFELDPKNGRIIKWFYLGPNKIYEDFEAVAINGEEFYLITSNGLLYKFYDQPDGKYSQYEKIRTGLTGSFEIEGMCYDPKTHSLLLASKNFAGKNYKDSRAVYSFDLNTKKLSDKPRFVISLTELEKKFNVKNFSPSGMERIDKTGNFLIISSGERGVLEISPSGRIVSFQELDKKRHQQPEGVTVLKDGTLLIADEGGKKKATLTGYKLK
jgi:uncharacterized protein YjiK